MIWVFLLRRETQPHSGVAEDHIILCITSRYPSVQKSSLIARTPAHSTLPLSIVSICQNAVADAVPSADILHSNSGRLNTQQIVNERHKWRNPIVPAVDYPWLISISEAMEKGRVQMANIRYRSSRMGQKSLR